MPTKKVPVSETVTKDGVRRSGHVREVEVPIGEVSDLGESLSDFAYLDPFEDANGNSAGVLGAMTELSDPNVAPETLRLAAQHESPTVREAVASHENSESDVLDYLSYDDEEMVRVAVAENPSTSRDTREFLKSDDSDVVSTAASARRGG